MFFSLKRMNYIKYFLYFPFICLFFVGITGCMTMTTREAEEVSIDSVQSHKLGVYHKIKPKETIWRIAKTYNVSVDDLVKANKISDISKIENGQALLIPGVKNHKNIILDDEGSQKEFIWPIKGKVIRYFKQHYRGQFNKGIDIQAHEGDLVKASRTGRVVFADYLTGYAYTVILDHSDGFYSVYARNAQLLIKVGDLVLKNNDIARVGKIGNMAYLHFEIRRNAVADNPLYYLQ